MKHLKRINEYNNSLIDEIEFIVDNCICDVDDSGGLLLDIKHQTTTISKEEYSSITVYRNSDTIWQKGVSDCPSSEETAILCQDVLNRIEMLVERVYTRVYFQYRGEYSEHQGTHRHLPPAVVYPCDSAVIHGNITDISKKLQSKFSTSIPKKKLEDITVLHYEIVAIH